MKRPCGIEGRRPVTGTEDSLWRRHPDGLPEVIPSEGRSVLIEPPSKSAPTWKWIAYRDACQALLADDPDNPKKVAFLAAAEDALVWRAALPKERRFWNDDGR